MNCVLWSYAVCVGSSGALYIYSVKNVNVLRPRASHNEYRHMYCYISTIIAYQLYIYIYNIDVQIYDIVAGWSVRGSKTWPLG